MMKAAKQQVVMMAALVVSGLLVFAASCSFEKQATDESGREQAEEVVVQQQAGNEPIEAQAKAEPAAKEAQEETFIANPFCAACHYGFDEEELALEHAQAGIGCERCHGESERHRSDEDNVTPPEIMYTKDKINPTCMMCHPRHEIGDVTYHEPLFAGAATIFDPEIGPAGNAVSQKIYCTTCHAKGHRVNVRSIRWNKATGELLKE